MLKENDKMLAAEERRSSYSNPILVQSSRVRKIIYLIEMYWRSQTSDKIIYDFYLASEELGPNWILKG